MPTPESASPLDWNEENLAKVIADLYREAETDDALRQRLMTEPFEVLSGRIALPESYRGGLFAREKGQDTMVLYVPGREAARAALPEGTTDAELPPDYQMLCSVHPVW